MKFGFKHLMTAMLGTAMFASAGQSAAKELPYAEALASLKSSGGSGSFPRSKRPATKRAKKQNKLRLSHNAKLKRRRAA